MAKHWPISAVNTDAYLFHRILKQPETVSNRRRCVAPEHGVTLRATPRSRRPTPRTPSLAT
jgi:hypothetical protein